jgi:hypothetical protein
MSYSRWSWELDKPFFWPRSRKSFATTFSLKARKFMNLVQGSMIIVEYVAKFTQLSRFVVYLILDEEKKARKFERGLNPCIGTQMVFFNINNFSQFVN